MSTAINIQGHFNYSLCKSCGGFCCQRYAGGYIPQDFKEDITVEFVMKLLSTGKYAIDWWDGDATYKNRLSNTYYIRPRHKNKPAIDPSYGGQCINWTRECGCNLPNNQRPFACRMLIPGIEQCKHDKNDHADKRGICIRWYPYQKILREARKQYTEKEQL